MQESVLKNRKNGLFVLIFSIMLYIMATLGVIFGAIAFEGGARPIVMIVSIVYLCVGWIP